MEEELLVALMYLGPVVILVVILLFVVAKSQCAATAGLSTDNFT